MTDTITRNAPAPSADVLGKAHQAAETGSIGRVVKVFAEALDLGTNQQAILYTLCGSRSGHSWSPGCGWAWSGPATTRRLLDGLVRKGLVYVDYALAENLRTYRLVPEVAEIARAANTANHEVHRAIQRDKEAQQEQERIQRGARNAAIADLLDRHADEFNTLLALHTARLEAQA